MTAPLGRDGRGRYRIRKGGKHEAPGVTSIVGLLDKGGLSWGAAKETALFAVYHKDEWMDLDGDAAYERLRKHHRGVWDAKAEVGNIVHDIALSWSEGREVDVAEMVRVDDKGRDRKWTGGHEIPFKRVNGCLDALERFYDDHQPVWIAAEQTVISTGTDSPSGIDPTRCYAGSYDVKAKLTDGLTHLIDYKSGARYPIETTLQLSAYEFAPWVGKYSADGDLEAVEANERTDAQDVLYLHDDGTYELLEVPADERAYNEFMGLRLKKAWLDDMEKWVKAHPEPTREPEE